MLLFLILEIRGAKNNLVFQLVPDNESQSLELEIWRLSSHIQLVKSLTGVDLKIIQKDKLD